MRKHDLITIQVAAEDDRDSLIKTLEEVEELIEDYYKTQKAAKSA